MNVGSPTEIRNSLSTVYSSCSRGDSLNVSLKPIEPYTKSKNFSERILYYRIKTEGLTPDRIRTLLLKVNVKKPNVIDIGDYFLFAYENYPPIYIKKENGLIYGKGLNFKENIEAIRILRQLNEFGLVEGFKRKQKHLRRTLSWLTIESGEER